MANKAYKYRIYPNSEQQTQFAKTFGCVRFVYNKCLDEQKRRYAAGEKHASRFELSSYNTRTLKAEYPFLREVDKFALSNAAFHLCDAYDRMFARQGGHPNYKSKHKSRASYTTNFTNGNIDVLNEGIKLPKVGVVKAKMHRVAPDTWRLKSAAVSQDSDGRYYVSVLYEYDAVVQELPVSEDTALGLDFKVSGLYADSNGDFADMPKWYKDSSAKLARKQRRLKHKKIGSNNYRKAQKKVAKLHKHVSNQRNDFLHKKSAAIAKQYDTVCIEDISVKQLVSERTFRNYRKSVLDNGWCKFTAMLDYKLRDKGDRLVKVDKHFSSSRLCSVCGELNPEVTDDRMRRWACPHCGATHDRDVNAAINIKREGLRMLEAS